MPEAYILSACRTPIGRFQGVFNSLSASQLGAAAIAEAVHRAGLSAERIEEVFFGNVIQGGQGQNPARQAALKGGLPNTVPATTVNMVCGSGLKSVALAAQAIRLGEADCIVAGGMESMSQAPYALPRVHAPFGHLTLLDLLLRDALEDVFDGCHMGDICERLGKRYGITREQQDAFAAMSQQRCAAAQRAGKFREEIVPVTVADKKQTRVVEVDEHPRPETTIEVLAKLRPAFQPGGCITAGNASGINDGAAALVMVSEKVLKSLNTPPLARIVSYACSATEPALFGIAPAAAVRKAVERAGLRVEQIDLIEANEAFAVQSLALSKELGWSLEKVNVNGGAIALGHPVGASGARILVTLLYELRRRKGRYGLATLCCGGGMGIAMVVESAPK